MKIKQHRPKFVDLDTQPQTIEFQNTEELLNIPFVKNFSTEQDFYKYSISVNHPGHSLLIAEYNKGQNWWVVGYLSIEENSSLNLPIWKPQKKT